MSIEHIPRLTNPHVCWSISKDGPPGNGRTDRITIGAPANACRWSWSSMAHVQASSTIEYLSSDNVDQGVLVNMMASMISFATSQVAIPCWGTFWSAEAMGCWTFCSPLDMGSGSAWDEGDWSDSDNLLRRVDILHLVSGGAIAQDGLREFGRVGRAMSVSVRLLYFRNGTLQVRNHLSRHAGPRCSTPCSWSTSTSWKSDHEVDTLVPSHLWSPISRSVSSIYFINDIGDISYRQYDVRWLTIGRQTFDGQSRLAAFLDSRALSRCASWFLCD